MAPASLNLQRDHKPPALVLFGAGGNTPRREPSMLILFLLLAIILFVLSAVDTGWRINMQSLGLAALTAAAIVYVL